MKKLFSIIFAVCMLISLFSACTNIPEQETTTRPETDISVTERLYESIVIESDKYKFTLKKTDFEKNYSEELLMKISALIPLQYGCDDYESWNGTPEEVINDAISCSFDSRSATFFERFSPDSPEGEKARDEIAGYKHKVYDNYVITNIDLINSFLSERFGPDVRQFKPEDFDIYEDVVTQDGSVTEGITVPGYRYIYLPESELVMCYMSEVTGWGGDVTALYVYDIQTVDGDYVVKAVYGISGYTEFAENGDSFAGLQGDALKMLEAGTYDVPFGYTMVIGETENGDSFMKSVTKSQISSEK